MNHLARMNNELVGRVAELKAERTRLRRAISDALSYGHTEPEGPTHALVRDRLRDALQESRA